MVRNWEMKKEPNESWKKNFEKLKYVTRTNQLTNQVTSLIYWHIDILLNINLTKLKLKIYVSIGIWNIMSQAHMKILCMARSWRPSGRSTPRARWPSSMWNPRLSRSSGVLSEWAVRAACIYNTKQLIQRTWSGPWHYLWWLLRIDRVTRAI